MKKNEVLRLRIEWDLREMADYVKQLPLNEFEEWCSGEKNFCKSDIISNWLLQDPAKPQEEVLCRLDLKLRCRLSPFRGWC